SPAGDRILRGWIDRALNPPRLQPAVGDENLLRAALPPSRYAQLAEGERLVRIQLRDQLVELGDRGDRREPLAHRTTGAKPLEVPGDVLAELHAALLLA